MKHDKPCCEVLEKLDIGWMKFEDGSRCAPYIMGKNDQTMWRVNHCPSCGKYIREIVLASVTSPDEASNK